MTRNERELKAVELERTRISQEIQAIWKTAEDEDRETSNDERGDVEKKMKDLENLKAKKTDLEQAIKVEQDVRAVSQSLGRTDSVVEPQEKTYPQPARPQSPGEQFVTSAEYKALRDGGFKGQFSTGDIELKTATSTDPLAEGGNWDASSGSPGAGAPLVPIDQRPGVQSILFQPLTIESLLASGVTTSNSVRYVVETVASSGAEAVAEAGEKKESTLHFEQTDTPVRKVPTILPVTDELLEDAPALQAYINARLGLFVNTEVEKQLLQGRGVQSQISGLLDNVPQANTDVTSNVASATAVDHIYAGITKSRGSFLEPDGIVIHPDTWAEIRLLKDKNENYIGGSPFSTGPGEPTESLFGRRVVTTTAMAGGTALVGSFGVAAQVFTRGGLTIEATNSHGVNFAYDITVIRAERRIALAVYRPESFVLVDLGIS